MSYNQIHDLICYSPSSFSSPSPSEKSNESKTFATKKWNLILSIFYEQMPLKCHWKYLWPYDNSFTMKEAVDFLLVILPKIIFGQTIQRANCSRLLQKFLLHGLIVNVRNPKDLEFTEKNATIFRFNDDRIQYEISKTTTSTFNDSINSYSSNPLIRRAMSNNAENFSHSDTRIPVNRSATVCATPPFSKTSKRNTLFSSFRNLKRSKRPEPVFNIPPPPSTPPPVHHPSQHYFRKRDSARFSPPNVNKKHPRLFN